MAGIDPSKITPEYLAADRSQTLIDTGIIFAVLDTLFISLFFFSRFKYRIPIGIDGWLMVPGYLLCLAHCVGDFLLVKYGHAGHHVVTASKAQINRWLKISVAEGYIYFPSTSFPKLAFLCLYLKIFTKKPYRYATFATIGVIVVSNIAFIITSAVDCPSSAYAWHTTGTSERCGDLLVMYRWASMPNLATDFVTILLPLPVTWHLHMTRAQKIGLTITFMIGCTGIFGAIFRFVLVMRTDLISDITWNSVQTMTWTTAEPSLYLIAACLPALRPLLKDFLHVTSFKDLRSRLRGSRGIKGSAGSYPSSSGETPRRPKPLDDEYGESLVTHPDVEGGRIYVGTDFYLQRYAKQ